MNPTMPPFVPCERHKQAGFTSTVLGCPDCYPRLPLDLTEMRKAAQGPDGPARPTGREQAGPTLTERMQSVETCPCVPCQSARYVRSIP